MEEDKNPTHIKVFHSRGLLQSLVHLLVLCCTFSIISVQLLRYFGVYSSTTAVSPNLIPCNVENLRKLDQRINPPSDLMHNMSDEELFIKASSMACLDKHRLETKPKIAFMFLTKGGLPLSPLWERFFKGYKGLFSIYVHSLPSYKADFRPESVFYKRHIPSQVSRWGKMSICDAERRLLANALLDIHNKRFVLLSESCIPLYNFTLIHNYITNSKYSFVNQFDDPGPHGRGRYNASMSPEINITEWRKGSQWFEVDRELASRIVRDTQFYPKFKMFCIAPCYADEHYIPTMLRIGSGDMLANRSLTWVDWSRGGSHPATFGGSDITERLLRRVYNEDRHCTYEDRASSVCYLFARKFSPSALEALFLIAPRYLGY